MRTAKYIEPHQNPLQTRGTDNASAAKQSVSVVSLAELLSVAWTLLNNAPVTTAERAVLRGISTFTDQALLTRFTEDIRQGADPLGNNYCQLKSAEERRPSGQTFTPYAAVRGMIDWAARDSATYVRVVDPGAGTGRYTFAALRRFPEAYAVAAELDPVLALIFRANAAVLGLTGRVEVFVGDFRKISLPTVGGKTLFIGNPPYVRHHDIGPEWKHWYSERLKQLGHGNSQLAGLHLHFFLKVLELARTGDEGCFITAAEWLDVNYGKALRDLLSNGLGGTAVFAVAPELAVFGDALVSAAVTCFAPGAARNSINFKRITRMSELGRLEGGHAVGIGTAHAEHRWTSFLDSPKRKQTQGFVALGDLFQVRRGQVTGLNRVWVAGAAAPMLPQRFLVPCITDSFDISMAPDSCILSLASLRRVIDLPVRLDELDPGERKAIDAFLEWARAQGAANGYIATHRKPWWKVNLKDPAPVVMTYMGRRPPVFARNLAGARLINVAHGLYPKEPLSGEYLAALVGWLNSNVTVAQGRAYAGGLIKFEPSEVMRLFIPLPAALLSENNNSGSLSKAR